MTPLAWLRRRRDRSGTALITQEQYEAGERLAADLWRARMTPRITASWSGVPGGNRKAAPGTGVEIPDVVIAAKVRIEHALAAVGPELGGLLIDICGDHRGLEDIEQAYGWPQRSGKIVLQLALTRLARHYGLLPPAEDERALRRRIRGWMAEDGSADLESWRTATPHR